MTSQDEESQQGRKARRCKVFEMLRRVLAIVTGQCRFRLLLPLNGGPSPCHVDLPAWS